jgi:hypothetical protein
MGKFIFTDVQGLQTLGGKLAYPRLASFGLSYIFLLFVLHLVDVRRIPFMEAAAA